MKKLLLLVLLIGLYTEDVLCMKRSRHEDSEESEDQRDGSDIEIEQDSESISSTDNEPIKQGVKRTRDKTKKEGLSEKNEKSSKKKRLPAKDAMAASLIKAMKSNNKEQVKSILEKSGGVDALDAFKNTALVYATETGDLDLVKIVYAKSLLAKESLCRALIVAAACGYKDIAAFLIDQKAKVNCTERGSFLAALDSIDKGSIERFGKCKVCPLLLAAYFGHRAVVELLLNCEATVDIRRISNLTPLLVSLEKGHDDCVELLLKAGARIQIRSQKIDAPLVVAARYNREKWIKEFLSKPKDVNPYDIIKAFITALEQGHVGLLHLFFPHITNDILYQYRSDSLIMSVARLGKEEVLEMLIEKATDKVRAYVCALAGAASEGNKLLAEKFIKRGADVNGNEGSPLLEAVRAGHRDMVTFLLQTGARLDVSWYIQNNIFRIAQEKGFEEILTILEEAQKKSAVLQQTFLESCVKGDGATVQALLKQKVKINLEDNQRRTPLMLAASSGNVEVVKALLEGKENSRLSESLMIAAAQGYTDVIRLLLDAGTQVNAKDYKPEPWNLHNPHYKRCDFTPLIHATINGHEEVVKLLLSRGADTLLKDSSGKDALTWAQEKGHLGLVKVLEEKAAKDKKVHAAFLNACAKGDIDKVKQHLGDPISSEMVDEQGKTGLELAVEYEHAHVAVLLLENTAHKSNAMKALKLVAGKGNERMVKFILSKCKGVLGALTRAVESAATHGHERIVNILLKASDRLDKYALMECALHAAIKAHNAAFVKKMLSSKKEDYWKKYYQATKNNPLLVAALAGSFELVKFFLEKGCPITIVSANDTTIWSPFAVSETKLHPGMNALMCAAQEGHLKIVEFLLEKEIDIETPNKADETALMIAASSGKKEIVQLLLRKGAKHIPKALSYAVRNEHKEIIQILIEASGNRQGALDVAVYVAAICGKLSLIQELHAQGAHLEARPAKEAKTILMIALERKQWDLVEFLLKAGANTILKDAKGLDAFAYAKNSGYEEKFTALVKELAQKKEERQKDFLQAVAQGNGALVQELISQGVNIRQLDDLDKTALMYAVASGNRELVEILAKAGVPVNARSKNGMSALSIAAQRENEAIVSALLRFSAQVDAASIGMAVSQGNARILKLLIQDSEDQQKSRDMALNAAAAFGKLELITCLLKQGAHINARGPQNKTALISAAAKGNEKCVELLLEARADVTLQDDAKLDALAHARNNDHESIVRMLEEAVSDKYQKQRALFEATKQGNKTLVQELLMQRVDSNAHDTQGRTVLMHAVTNGHKEVVDLLVKEGANINLVDKSGDDTALSLAVDKAGIDLVKVLISVPEKISLETLEYALRLAARRGLNEIVKVLLTLHSNKAQALSLTLHEAVRGQRKELAEYLLEAGADVNNIVEQTTPLMTATCRNATDIIKLLLARGALINNQNPDGFSAFDSATQAGALESLAFLIGSENASLELVHREALKVKLQQELNICFIRSRHEGLDGFLASLAKQNYEEILFLIYLVRAPEIKVYLKDKVSCCAEYIRVYKEEGKCIRSALHQTPLMWACMFGHTDIVQRLLKNDLPHWFINAQDIHGRTALHYAVLYGHTECIQELLRWYSKETDRIKEVYKDNHEAQKKASTCLGINVSDSQGNTALFYAITKGNLLLVSNLLKANAKLSASKNKAALALKIAAAKGWDDVVIRILFKLKEFPAIFE